MLDGILYVLTTLNGFVNKHQFIFNIISSAITAWITVRITYNSEIKKMMLKKREEVYADLVAMVDKVVNNPNIVFSNQFIDELIKRKQSVKLFATSRTSHHYASLYMLIGNMYQEYLDFCEKNDPQINMVGIMVDECGEEIEVHQYSETDIRWFENVKMRKSDEILSRERKKLLYTVDQFVNSMRNDIGNRKIRFKRK